MVFVKQKILQKNKLKNIKWLKEYYRRFDNLNKKELNKKNNKEAYIRNDVMTTVIKRSRGEKKRGIRKIDGFRKKLMILDSEISKCP